MSSTLKRKAASSVDASKKIKTGGGNASITSFFGAPKIVSSSTNGSSAPRVESPAPTFDKDKWVASLKDEQRELLQLEIDTLDESWLAHLKDEVTSKEFLDLKKFLAKEMAGSKKIFPPPQDIYSWYAYLIPIVLQKISFPVCPALDHTAMVQFHSRVHQLTNSSPFPGHGSHRSTRSSASFLVKTPTTTSTKPTASPSRCGHRHLPRRLCATCL